jgi:hypothetical protein
MSFEDEREENEGEKEEVTLIEVEEEGILVLMDGRRLRVDPQGIDTAILWLPTSTLEVSELGEEDLFDVSVTLRGTDQWVRAHWE